MVFSTLFVNRTRYDLGEVLVNVAHVDGTTVAFVDKLSPFHNRDCSLRSA